MAIFDPQPIILEHNAVRLEPLSPGHADDLFHAGLDPAIWPYMPIPYPDTLAKTHAWIQQAIADQANGSSIAFAIIHVQQNRAVGSTRYLDIQRENFGLEIGWTWIGADYQRTAVNTECKFLLMSHAFEVLGAERVQLKTDGRNQQSQNAIERIGAKKEGILRKQRVLWDGFIRDTVYYSVIKKEWPRVKQAFFQKSHLTMGGQASRKPL